MNHRDRLNYQHVNGFLIKIKQKAKDPKVSNAVLGAFVRRIVKQSEGMK